MKSSTRLLAATAGALLIGAGLAGCGGSSSSHHSSTSAFPVKVGEVGPIASSNPRQQPFECHVQLLGPDVAGYGPVSLGEPVVDNQDGVGHEVIENGQTKGYSADCGAPTQVAYLYRKDTDGKYDSFHLISDVNNLPSDIMKITVDGDQIPFIVRYEIGTINRFIYTVVSLAPTPADDQPGAPDKSYWNNHLLFHFIGGIGIGHSQASKHASRDVVRAGHHERTIDALKDGFAVIASTGAAATTTYNLKLTGQTAVMVKKQFVAEFGDPDFTLGIGSSGGAIQQLIYAQNHPDLLDGLIPIQPYQDMISQVSPVGDCALLSSYFDRINPQINGGTMDATWKTWQNREYIVGLHGIDGYTGASPKPQQLGSQANTGTNGCWEAWFGAVAEYFNPLWSEESFSGISPTVKQETPFSFFDDLAVIFGTEPDSRFPNHGLAHNTFDNVGVQYGLAALNAGLITEEQFLDLNAHVGGFKDTADFVYPGFPFDQTVTPSPQTVDPWGTRNQTAAAHTGANDIAPRSEGSIQAMKAAFQSGQVFGGDIDQPVIIILPYLEGEFDMHASREAFAVRKRMMDAKGNTDNLVIWMPGSDDKSVMSDLIVDALNYQIDWLENNARPSQLKNACFDNNGDLIAEGAGVFAGEVTGNGDGVPLDRTGATNEGICTHQYPIYSDSRVVAGNDVGEHVVFKCALKPVSEALTDGTFDQSVSFTAAQKTRLGDIFPDGVCDYSKPGQGMPAGWM